MDVSMDVKIPIQRKTRIGFIPIIPDTLEKVYYHLF
jgi:hypothetical protein